MKGLIYSLKISIKEKLVNLYSTRLENIDFII